VGELMRRSESANGSRRGRWGVPPQRFTPQMSGPPQVAYRNGGSETGQGPVNERPRGEWGESPGGCGVARLGGRTETVSAVRSRSGMTGAAFPRRTARSPCG
jgi:hypothetical protein